MLARLSTFRQPPKPCLFQLRPGKINSAWLAGRAESVPRMYAISTPCSREIKAQLRRRLRGHPSSGASRDTTIPKLRPLPRAVQSLCLYFCFLFSLFFYFSLFFLRGRGYFNPPTTPVSLVDPAGRWSYPARTKNTSSFERSISSVLLLLFFPNFLSIFLFAPILSNPERLLVSG